MLKVDRGNVEINGRTDIILSELSGLIFSLRENKVAPDELIKSAIDKGFLSKEEIDNKVKNIIKKMSSEELFEAIKDYLV